MITLFSEGPYDESEVHGSHELLCLVFRDMLALVDAGIISAGFVQAVRDHRAHVLASLPAGMWEKGKRRRLSDGSELVQLKPNKKGCYPLRQPIWVRIICYRVTDSRLGEVGKVYRLVTTLLNPQRAPAKELVVLYHERWEIELVIDEAACQAGLDPDRLSFTEAMFQLCEMIPFAQIMEPQDTIPLRKRLEHKIAAAVLPVRLLRVNRREVKQVYNKHKPKKRNLPPPKHFEPGQRFEDFVQMVDPLALCPLSAQEELPSVA